MAETELHLRKFQKELCSGLAALVLLTVLAREGRAMYGYQIAKQLENKGEGALAGKQSALYPVLRSLHGAGLLESFVEPSVSGPPRRYYEITAVGREVLGAWIGEWRQTREFVQTILTGEGA